MVASVLGEDFARISPDPVFSFNRNCDDFIPGKRYILEKFNLPEDYVLLSFGKHYNNAKYIENVINELKKII